MGVTGRMLGLALILGLPAVSVQAGAPAAPTVAQKDVGDASVVLNAPAARAQPAVWWQGPTQATSQTPISRSQPAAVESLIAEDSQRPEAVPPAFLALGLALLGLVVVARRGPAARKRSEGVLQAAGRV
ncbi:hypothetical protein [Alkalilimnicola sp. S0819]|uniref:hypothetical protein n=1 Tax=Alkalilimnicola sp. S0819 TaxID=2613922 RepID=UPI00128E86AF|nr:hypothetical protein [Alkalilimnicola sp. S0819]